jgi:hypothetical protein
MPATLAPTVRPALPLAAVAAAAHVAANAAAAVLTWTNPAGGSAFAPGNWSPPQVPTGADVLVFGLGSAYTVTFGGGASGQIIVSNGDPTLVAPHAVLGTLTVGSTANVPVLRLTGGTLTVPVALIADGASASAGVVSIDGGGAGLFASSALIAGDDGAATLEVLNGGAAIATTLAVGQASDASGFVTVQSGGPAASVLQVLAVASVGADGDGEIAVQEGGEMSVGAHLLIATGASSSGTVRLDGSISPLPPSLTVGGDVHVGHSATGGPAGQGLLLLADGATVEVGGTTFVGNDGGGQPFFDRLTVDGDAHLVTGSLVREAAALVSFLGGSTTIDGGVLTWPASQTLAIGGATGTAILQMRNGAQGALSVPSGAAILLGSVGGGAGHFTLQTGASCTIPAGFVSVQYGALAVGAGCTLDVAGGIIADANPATITVTGELSAANVTIGNGNVMSVSGSGARVTLASQSHVGGSPLAPDTGGTLGAAFGGIVESPSSIVVHRNGVLQPGPFGLFTVDAIDLRGTIELIGGTIDGTTVIVGDDALVTGTGKINARIDVAAPSLTNAVIASGLSGLLTIGDPNSTIGFVGTGGTLIVNPAGVVVRDADGADLGAVELAGGTLTLPPAGAMLPAERTMSGSGSVAGGDLRSAGPIVATDAGIVFACLLTGPTPATVQDVSGTVVTFANGGGFTGQGAIDARIVGHGGAAITATGPLTIGDATSPTGVEHEGVLHVGAHAVTLDDATDVGLGALTTIDGGTLAAGGAITVGPSDVLRFTGGAVQSASLINAGLVESLAPAAALTVTGGYLHAGEVGPGDLRLAVDASGAARVDVEGAAALGGDLILALVGAPVIGATHTVLTADAITATFDAVVIDGFPSCLGAVAEYGATEVTVTIGRLCPDVECDNTVGFSDLLAVLADWGPCPGCASDVAPPVVGDGEVDFADLLRVLASWGVCAG